MRIGITCTLKDPAQARPDAPDDLQEEFDSPETIGALAEVLRRRGHEVELLGDGRGLMEKLLQSPPEFVFNLAEGRGASRSREAWVPSLLEMLGIPFSGSDPLTLAVTLDKPAAKTLVAAAGVAVPAGLVVARAADAARLADPAWQGRKVILKPAWEGSSKGIRGACVVTAGPDLKARLEELRAQYDQPILAEEFIAGEELTVGVVGNEHPEVVGVLRVVPRQPTSEFVYSLEVKRDYENRVRYESPPQLPEEEVERVRQAALSAFVALGCRDVARLDFRLREGVPYFLEVNPLPGINPITSDLVILAGLNGWSYERLMDAVLDAAFARHGLKG
ncbi:MAG TPA: ATP-grasp domain-containing protein [Gemmatales bacterium]|nr:ATP-grasp domain-containing protein [Gemmatales bacterium]